MTLLLLLLGCRPTYETVEDACRPGGKVGGDKHATDMEAAYFHRVNCYRRYLKIDQQRVSKTVHKAVTAHAEYLDANYGDTPPSLDLLFLMGEDPSLPGYTGPDDFARLDAVGDDFSANDNGLWFTAGFDPGNHWAGYDWAEVADSTMEHFISRQLIVQPDSSGAAIGFAGPWLWQIEKYAFPPSRTRPIVWPRDGDVDVPIETYNGFDVPGFPLEAGVWHGYHISVTVGDDQSNGFTSDPFGIIVESASLVGPGGEEPLIVIPPSTPATPGELLFTVGFVPEFPLQPGTTYEFNTTMSWMSEHRDITSTFTTAN